MKPKSSTLQHDGPLQARVRQKQPSVPSRRDPSQSRSRDTVDAIVEAAGQLLVEHGREAVTTNAVAERAGVSIGSVYQYFPNKEAIFSALQRKHRDKVMPLVQHSLHRLCDPAVDLVDGVVTLMRAMVELHEAEPARMRASVDELHETLSFEDIQSFTDGASKLLVERTGQSLERVQSTAWLAAVTLTQVARTLVHQPPSIAPERIFQDLARMLQGLFSSLPIQGASAGVVKEPSPAGDGT